MTPEQLLERIQGVMTQHVLQIESNAHSINEKGKMAGYADKDSQVIERYAKILITLTKKSGTDDDEFANKSDEELRQILNGESDNVDDETSED